MRTRQEIQADIDALGCPPARFAGGISGVMASMAERRAWRESNPAGAVALEALYGELDALERAERELRDLEALERRLRAVGVGERSATSSSAPTDTPAMAAARTWFGTGKTWLLFGGDTGQGKTVAAAWLLRQALAGQESAAFRVAGHVATLSAFDDGAKELEHLKRVGMLVLDDIGTEAATAWGKSVLHQLLDARHEAKRRTVLTGNFKRADARVRLGDRLADRIQQDGTVVWLEGASLRRTGS